MKKLEGRILNLLKQAKEASLALSNISAAQKNRALLCMASDLLKNSRFILSENSKDVALAKEKGLSRPLVERLTLTEGRIKEMADSLKQITKLEDPVGRILKQWKRPNGLVIKKISVPIGVIGIIYESRPNVTSDCAGLSLKSGNACVLRGGSESINSNIAIHRTIAKGLGKFGIPEAAVTLIDVADRKAMEILLKQDLGLSI